MRKRILPYLLIAFCTAMIACSKANEEDLRNVGPVTPACDTVNMKLAANIVPILSANCYSCHGNGRSSGGVQLDVYATLRTWATTGGLLGVITHAPGFSPMPKNAAKLSDCDINKITDWINRGALNN